MSAFFGRHDFYWSSLPTVWEKSAFIGNGNLGATLYLQDQKPSWEINRTDFYVQGSRIPVGRLSLETADTITGGKMRLDLWNAEATGTLSLGKGEVTWRSIAVRDPQVIVIEIVGGEGNPLPGISWHPAFARPARTTFNRIHLMKGVTTPPEFGPDDLHPPADVTVLENGFIGTQVYLKDGAAAVVARGYESTPGRRVYYIAVERADTVAGAIEKAEATIAKARALPLDAQITSHREWWHGYYPQSFVSLPDDPALEAFYWRQIYKLGSAMRPDGPILDLLGPWFRATRWPRIWWNLNIQLTYHPLNSSNRLELAESLYRNLDRHREQLINNVLPARPQRDAAVIGRTSDQTLRSPIRIGRTDGGESTLEAGNLPWVAYLYWEFYRHQMDDSILRDRVFPLLALAVGHYLTHIETDAAGVIHLKPTHSPEHAIVGDANYDLSLFRWGLETLIASCEQLKLDEPRLPVWRDTLARLTPFPMDATGLMLGRNLPLDVAHRHFSHLLAIYPLHLIDLESAEERALAERSIAHWLSVGSSGHHTGYTYTIGAAMLAALGHGDRAHETLSKTFPSETKQRTLSVLHPNTFYVESGGPTIETPLSVVTTVNDMLLQSWGGVLRVFPAAPALWQNASFANLRAQGAFLVSAERRDGRVRRVEIRSLAGEPCRVRVPGWTAENVRVVGHEGQAEPPRLTALPNGDLLVGLEKNACVVLEP
ncbi:MAG: glycoside hydrolase family 95-like protein [Verrucomicrobiota bacterium]